MPKLTALARLRVSLLMLSAGTPKTSLAVSVSKETRNRAKAVNFGIVYGISPFGLAAQLGIPQAEARAYIDRYFARYQGVQAFIEKTLAETRREGSVRTLFGRVRPI